MRLLHKMDVSLTIISGIPIVPAMRLLYKMDVSLTIPYIRRLCVPDQLDSFFPGGKQDFRQIPA